MLTITANAGSNLCGSLKQPNYLKLISFGKHLEVKEHKKHSVILSARESFSLKSAYFKINVPSNSKLALSCDLSRLRVTINSEDTAINNVVIPKGSTIDLRQQLGIYQVLYIHLGNNTKIKGFTYFKGETIEYNSRLKIFELYNKETNFEEKIVDAANSKFNLFGVEEGALGLSVIGSINGQTRVKYYALKDLALGNLSLRRSTELELWVYKGNSRPRYIHGRNSTIEYQGIPTSMSFCTGIRSDEDLCFCQSNYWSEEKKELYSKKSSLPFSILAARGPDQPVKVFGIDFDRSKAISFDVEGNPRLILSIINETPPLCETKIYKCIIDGKAIDCSKGTLK